MTAFSLCRQRRTCSGGRGSANLAYGVSDLYADFGKILKTPPFARFSRADGDIVVEIGFGNGEYLEHLAATNPESTVVGIEVSRWCLSKAARRALVNRLSNVRLVHGDARYLLVHAFEPESLSAVYMNYPCPWPKKRHAGRRVASSEFASVIASALVGGGRFTLATDVDWYADATRDVFFEHGAFDVGAVQFNPIREYSTKYERKWLEMGRSIYTLEVVKKMNSISEQTLAADSSESSRCDSITPTGQAYLNVEASDDGCVLSSSDESGETLSAHDTERFKSLLSAMTQESVIRPEYRLIFSDVFFSGDGSALIKVISVDDGFEQHYFIRVAPSGDSMRGKLETVGHPYITPGVRASLRYLAKKTGIKF